MASLPPNADLSKIPSGAPPLGTKPNFINPPSLEKTTLIWVPILMALAVICVSSRLLQSFGSFGKLLGDDFCCIFATMFTMARCGLILAVTQYARHSWDIPVSWLTPTYQKTAVFLPGILGSMSYALTKISLLLLYLRLLQSTQRSTRIIIYTAIAWTIATYLPFLGVTPHFCAPPAGKPWALGLMKKCAKPSTWYILSSAMGVVLDMFLWGFGALLIWRARGTAPYSIFKKLGLLVLLSVGVGVVACSALTLHYRIIIRTTKDPFWEIWKSFIYTATETNILLILTSIPSLHSLFSPKSSTLTTSNAPPTKAISERTGSRDSNSTSEFMVQHGEKSGNLGRATVSGAGNPATGGTRNAEGGIVRSVEFEMSSARGSMRVGDDREMV